MRASTRCAPSPLPCLLRCRSCWAMSFRHVGLRLCMLWALRLTEGCALCLHATLNGVAGVRYMQALQHEGLRMPVLARRGASMPTPLQLDDATHMRLVNGLQP